MLLAAGAVAAVSVPSQLAASAALEWTALLPPLYCFTVLTGVFAADGEAEGTLLYGVGALCHWLALCLLAADAILPAAPLLLLSPVWAGGMLLSVRKLGKRRESRLWQPWHDGLGVLGVALLFRGAARFLSGPGSGALLQAAGTAVGLLLLLADRVWRLLPLKGAWALTPAWCATLLFMVDPAADVAAGLAGQPVDLPALLGLATVALQVPRALLLRSRMFATGTSFCSLAAVLACLRQPAPALSAAVLAYAAALLAAAVFAQLRRTAEG